MSRRAQSEQRRHGRGWDLRWWQDIALTIRLYRDPRISFLVKAFAPFVAALYVLSPLDLIPDFLLGVGQIDDLGVLAALAFVSASLIRRLAPRDIVEEHLAEMGVVREAATSDAQRPPGNHSGEFIDASFTVTERSATRTG